MAFDSSFPKAVGFLLGEVQKAGGADLEPLGTFFVLQIQRDADTFAAMVTSRHVVADQSLVIARLQDGSGAPIEWDVSGWIYPADGRSDWAVRPFEPPPSAQGPFTAVPDWQAHEVVNVRPKAGTTVYFPGLLTGVPSLVANATPIVRSGSVAAWEQSGVTWTTRIAPSEVKRWTADRVHLVDVRSWGGFSGSPCFLQFQTPGPRRQKWPDLWFKLARSAGNDPEDLGEIHTFTVWFGMFAAHIEESGIGVVVPSDLILDLIRSEVA